MALEGSLAVDAGQGAVTFAFTVENAGPDPVELTFRSGMVADVAVFDGETEVWRWSHGRAFTQALVTETLEPGESFTHEATWDGPSPGEYVAEATLAATDVDLTVRESFLVEE